MPVHKYRSVEEMPAPSPASSADLAARIRAVWSRALRICPLSPPRGVTRFASIEAANEGRLRATLDRMRKTAEP